MSSYSLNANRHFRKSSALMLPLNYRQVQRVATQGCWRSRRSLTFSKRDLTKDSLRRLLRETAQPVAVVTSFYPFDGAEDAKQEMQTEQSKKFHGATLSSFTSIALDPHPLIAFSLRIPSRMATSLKDLMLQRKSRPSLVVNLLASTQANTAHHFARADLFPEPFRITPYSLTADGLPVLNGALGAISCELVSCMPLHELCDKEAANTEGVISELFISRVLRVETEGTLAPGSGALPLIYHNRQYATSRPL